MGDASGALVRQSGPPMQHYYRALYSTPLFPACLSCTGCRCHWKRGAKILFRFLHWPWLHAGRYLPTRRLGAGPLVRRYSGRTCTGKNRQASLGAHSHLFLAFQPFPCYTKPMPRHARIVIPGIPHHLTQRGNDRRVVLSERGF